jgi:hypothetical protein
MRNFLFKLAVFGAPFILLALTVLVFQDSIQRQPFHNGLERKVNALIKPGDSKLRIVVGGDSRAEGQIVPKLLSTQFGGVDVVNVALAGCDLISLKKALEKNGVLDDTALFVIGVSSFQINDRTLEYGYISPATLVELSPLEALRLFRHEPAQFFPNYQGLLQRYFQISLKKMGLVSDPPDQDFGVHRGHTPLIGRKTETPFKIEHREHPQNSWFRHVANRGVRARLFSETLEELSKKPGVFILFHPGMSPKWNAFFGGTRSQRAEDEFSEFLRLEASRFQNIIFIDFNRDYRNAFSDSLYFDAGHLNAEGAVLFTEKLATLALSTPRVRELVSHRTNVNILLPERD